MNKTENMCNMKYLATWQANNSTYGQLDGNNLDQIARDVREITTGNVFVGNTGFWSVDLNDGYIHEAHLKSGSVSR